MVAKRRDKGAQYRSDKDRKGDDEREYDEYRIKQGWEVNNRQWSAHYSHYDKARALHKSSQYAPDQKDFVIWQEHKHTQSDR